MMCSNRGKKSVWIETRSYFRRSFVLMAMQHTWWANGTLAMLGGIVCRVLVASRPRTAKTSIQAGLNWSILPNSTQKYSENLYTSRVKDLVESHNISQPLYMMYNMQSVHYPFFAPDAYFSEDCLDKENASCVRQAMLNAAQDSLSEVIESYKEAGIWNNTLMIVASDNGAQASRFASSLPLRGWKNTLFEGGVRVPAFLYSPNPDILVPRGSTSCYIHVTDWFSSLINWTGGWEAFAKISKVRKSQIYTLDSIDQSDFLFTGNETSCLRNEILVHINPVNQDAAYIKGDYKALFGLQSMSSQNDPFETNNLSETHPDVLEELKEKIIDHFHELEPLQCTLPDIKGAFPTEVMHYFLPFDFEEIGDMNRPKHKITNQNSLFRSR
eukprot:sb/3465612/